MSLSTHCRESFWSSRDWVTTMRREMSDHQKAVGRRLLALRKTRNASQEDAAHVAGVSLTTWRNWERGLTAPYESSWKKLRAGFELTDEQVASIRGTPPSPLGLGSNGSEPSAVETQILEALDDIIERLERLEGGPPEPGRQP